MPDYLTPKDMVERYRGAITVGTLANWRWTGFGPKSFRIGGNFFYSGKVIYDLADVEEWECSRFQVSIDQPHQRPGNLSGCVCLTPSELADRLVGTVTMATLANWRSKGRGPVYFKIGFKVLYRGPDVEAWERSRRQASGDQPEGTR